MMNTRADRLDRMLNVTAELFFGVENSLFFRRFGEKGTTLLDIGCGNGTYLACIGEHYPDMRLTGVEIEEEMCRKAQDKQKRNLTFVHGSYEQLTGTGSYDTILARLVVPHIPDRSGFVKWLYEHTSEQSTVIVIDFDDERYRDNDELPLFSSLYKKARQSLKRKGTFLELPDALLVEFRHAGFVHLGTEWYSVRTDRRDLKQVCREYMLLATEYLLDTPITAEREKELDRWLDNDDSFLEIPMFGIVFGRSSGVL
ncbi:methyltransferase domain-containing protein [Paenibacillus mesophilus]|uniref:methyltransferase domain-containing protein n=1 Tax=Paenibacillus mesophilus TaxID=2582849 RepID=UPI00110F5098|nr:methyltransferase domain-containing protein [Paenibacillus mesophilus]TMV50285.1 methyltransferase domain-containing protein [Paenibacillus mesophilus]